MSAAGPVGAPIRGFRHARSRYRWHVSGTPARTIHQLKIGLQGAAPPLWRRIQVPSEASLGFLHDVIQETFGWGGYHLHRFEDERGREWGEQDRLDGGYTAFADEEEASL